jgi:hypothetical protein
MNSIVRSILVNGAFALAAKLGSGDLYYAKY